MAELKTKATRRSVKEFLAAIPDEQKRRDSAVVFDLMGRATGEPPRMWGDSMVGFGDYHYVGRSSEGDWFLAGFSPRKQALTLYVTGGWDHHDALLAKLGKHSLGKGCLYLKRLDDVDVKVLERLVVAAVKRAEKQAQAEAKDRARSAGAGGD
jgi:hypothetical protein